MDPNWHSPKDLVCKRNPKAHIAFRRNFDENVFSLHNSNTFFCDIFLFIRFENFGYHFKSIGFRKFSTSSDLSGPKPQRGLRIVNRIGMSKFLQVADPLGLRSRVVSGLSKNWNDKIFYCLLDLRTPRKISKLPSGPWGPPGHDLKYLMDIKDPSIPFKLPYGAWGPPGQDLKCIMGIKDPRTLIKLPSGPGGPPG